MNGVMSSLCGCNQKFWIKYPLFSMNNIVNTHWVDVMNQHLVVDLEPRNTKVTTIISYDYMVSQLSPLMRTIERLIDVSIESESLNPDLPSEFKILKAFLERPEVSKF